MILASGDRLGPYEIEALIGSGGMGEVYRAKDTRLNRVVAIKVVSPHLAANAGFRERFEGEAHTISQLNHPNICTLYDIGRQGDLSYFVMEFLDGETLAQRIARGPIAAGEAVQIAEQIARALAAAHALAIVHRDIKPANVMLTRSDFVKVLDFGLAKAEQPRDATASGLALGTLAYMAPERLLTDGHSGTASDVWALGVVLYEMLTGTPPFTAKSEVALFKSILSDRVPAIAPVHAVPRGLKRIIDRALEKDPDQRISSAAELEANLNGWRNEPTPGPGPLRLPAGARKWTLPAALVLGLVAAALATAAIVQSRHLRWAKDEALPEIERLVQQDRYLEAFELAEQAEAYVPDEPKLAALWPAISVVGSWETTPPGAAVLFKEYSTPDNEWVTLGVTPLHDVRLPRGALRFLVQKEGFEPLHLARAVTTPFAPEAIVLRPAGSLKDMVPVPGDTQAVNLSGFNVDDQVRVGPFRIDRTEVTNQAYQEFVDARGYGRQEFWQNGGPGPATFVDTTGDPGPATWAHGEHAQGHGDEPVGGVSWFEAAAYCQFRGKALPTIYHWARAALAPREITAPLGPAIVPLSNFSGKGVASVASFRGMGPYGTFDTAGNVREWVWNRTTTDSRWILGGSWNDPDYMFSLPFSLPPSDRSPTNGFRCISLDDDIEVPKALLANVDLPSPDYRNNRPASDEVFEVLARQFSYIPAATAAASVEARVETPGGSLRERVTLDAGYDNERMQVYVFLPENGRPPYQAVIYFPALNAFQSLVSSSTFYPADYVVKTNRAVVLPVFKGSFERWDPALGLSGEEYFRAIRQRLLQWRQDLGRTLDYLATRGDIDVNRIGYYGRSFGASMPLPLLALEPRLKLAILHSAGFTNRRLPAETDAVNYVSRIRIPVLMMTGRHDYVLPYETSQKPLFDLLGTPARDKRHIIYEAGHDPLPRRQVITEILGWLDRYLGPSATQASTRSIDQTPDGTAPVPSASRPPSP